MWKNIVEPQMTIWGVCIACWIQKATNTHSEYVILFAFPLQQGLYERASVLRYTYIAGLVKLRWWRRGINSILKFNQNPLFLCVLVSECRGSFPDNTSSARPLRYSYMVEFPTRL